ncbi:uncharacterized protein LOC136086269 [Hydra vulgaris]|uniref:Uncharacterized protein LOC136086269 n=1 Tax=Hydra vulgaris TaxID=6087 RepID=A0ABM4CRW9_HYDVU
MSICVQSVSENFTIFEDFLGLYAIDATDSKSLFYAICNVLLRYGLDKKMMWGKSYDGAASMPGHLSVVAKLFQDDFNEATFIHCYAHRLNLYFNMLVNKASRIFKLNDPNRAKAEGLLDKLLSFQLYFWLRLAYDEFVSQHMQSAEVDAQTFASSIILLKTRISYLRSETRFKLFFESCVNEGVRKFGCSLPHAFLPCRRLTPSRFDDNTLNIYKWDTMEYYRTWYYEVLDVIESQLNQWFPENSMESVIALEWLLLITANGDTDIKALDNIKVFYKNDIVFEKLKAELSLFKSIKETYNITYKMNIKQVTSITAIIDMLNDCKGVSIMFSEISKLLKVYLVIPLITCTVERLLSCLRIMKSYSRSNSTQKRLNHLLLLQFYKLSTAEIDVKAIAIDFINGKSKDQSFLL